MVFGLENILFILSTIGNPHEKIKTIHIGGTNGKGSVAYMISEILQSLGYNVGLYTSPHLCSFTERIRVKGQKIKEEEVVELTSYIKEKIEEKDKNRFFTFFDFTTALAFEYFHRKKVDIGVIEVGLGGRLDSTNVINPLVSVITNVDYDHMDVLGPTLFDIAKEKAGIIKAGVPVIAGSLKETVAIIEERAKALKSPLFLLDRDFSFKKVNQRHFDYFGPFKTLYGVEIGLEGDHQFTNASLALCVLELLERKGFSWEEGSIRKTLKEIKWEGRLEFIKKTPLVLLDGAHNIAGIQALSQYLKDYHGKKRKILVFGVLKDKEYGKMLEEIEKVVDFVILTRPKSQRAQDPALLKAYVKKEYLVEKDLKEAIKRAFDIAKEDDLIVITGSFYTVGEAKLLINEDLF